MPTILRRGPYRLFFYSGDRDEPIRDDNVAKFWLNPIRLEKSGGFRRPELARIARIVEDHRLEIVETWNEYFGD